MLLVLVIALVAVALTIGKDWFSFGGVNAQPNSKLHQAVFLSNGQVYFGKIKKIGSDSIVLTDIYYLQVVQQPLQQQVGADGQPAPQQPAPAPQGQPAQTEPALNLVKIGSEIHGPVDKMVIPTTNIVFWEDIKDDGVVGKAIKEFKARQTSGDSK